MLWASQGHLMALGLENEEPTRKSKCHPLCGQVASPPFPGGSRLCSLPAPGALLGWACCFCSGHQGPASGGSSLSAAHFLESCLHASAPRGSPLGRTYPLSLSGPFLPLEAP